jgi:hypothetical protein
LAVGLGVTIFIGAGFTLLADEFQEFKAARICFAVAGMWAYGDVVMWGIDTPQNFALRACVLALVSATITVSFVEVMRLTTRREIAITVLEPKPTTPTTGENPAKELPPQNSKSNHRPKPREESPVENISTITVEARMTCTIKEGEELPPSTEDIIAGFGTGKLVGPRVTTELSRTNPVEFRKQRDNEMIVVNHFYLPSSESLMGSPVSRIANYETMVLPITVLGSGRLFDQIRLVEVTVTINNKHTWYYPHKIGSVPFEGGGPNGKPGRNQLANN